MVWKKSKNKKVDRDSKKLKPVPEDGSEPKLKSILKNKKNDVNSVSSDQDSSQGGESVKISADVSSTRDQSSTRSGGSRSSPSTNGSKSFGSLNSVSSSARRRTCSAEMASCASGSSAGNNTQSPQNSERSYQSYPVMGETMKKTVRFNAIQIRDYERVVGDNPSCTAGPPLSIGWKYGKTKVIDVNTYEQSRPYRKSSVRLILSREEREALLLNWGASFHDIVESVRGNIKVKNQRRQTVTNLGKVERIEEAFESATRKLKRALLLRKSTGNKVKRLQEQANLAQSALTSLKIAEDRALDEIRRGRMPRRDEPEKDELESYHLDVAVANYGRTKSQDNGMRRPSQLVVSEQDDYYNSFDVLTLGGNSTTPSQLEMERFYRELEMEMFGDEELPSMVGQTLELPTDIPARERVCNEMMASFSSFNLDDSLNSGIPPSFTDIMQLQRQRQKLTQYQNHQRKGQPSGEEDLTDDLDAALELEQNRSMISQSLLDDDSESTKTDQPYYENYNDQDVFHHRYPLERMYPLHGDYCTSRYHSATNRVSCSSDSADQNRSRLTESVGLEYQFRQQPELLLTPPPEPLHAGMTMFEDCALLGGYNPKYPCYDTKQRRPSWKDSNAGPKVHHMPPLTPFSPSHWMEDVDTPPLSFQGGIQTITISEDSDCGDYNNSYYYPRGLYPQKYVSAQQFPSSFY